MDSAMVIKVKSGTLFDNVVITDDPEYAKQLAEETWGKQKDVEKAAFEEAEKKKEEEESKDDPVDYDAEEDDEDADKASNDTNVESKKKLAKTVMKPTKKMYMMSSREFAE